MSNNNYWSLDQSIIQFKNKSLNDFFYSEKYLLNLIKNNFESVLDIGCASGKFIELLNQYSNYFSYYGIDFVEEQIRIANKNYNYKNYNFVLGDFLTFKFKKKYDLVNATGIIQHTYDFKNILLKMISLSCKYVIFDFKVSNEIKNLTNIDQSFIKMSNDILPYIVFSKKYIFDFLKNQKEIEDIVFIGYETRNNKNAVIYSDIKKLYSVGVLIKLNQNNNTKKEINISGKYLVN